MLTCACAETSVNWVEVAKRLPGRNNKDCRKRWTKISEKWQKGSWAHDENQRLRDGVAQHGTRFVFALLVSYAWLTILTLADGSPWQRLLEPEVQTVSEAISVSLLRRS